MDYGRYIDEDDGLPRWKLPPIARPKGVRRKYMEEAVRELLDYKFIVVNKANLDPMVWSFPDTSKTGTLVYGKNGQVVCGDPLEIGRELSGYLSSRPKRPVGIGDDNDLVEFLNDM